MDSFRNDWCRGFGENLPNGEFPGFSVDLEFWELHIVYKEGIPVQIKREHDTGVLMDCDKSSLILDNIPD